MDADEASGSNNAPHTKKQKQKQKQKQNDEAGPSGNASIIDASNPVKQTGDIFKLDIDCYEEAFDYLPIGDLINVGKTCKRLQQVAGYCFQQHYTGIAECYSSGIQSCHHNLNINHFASFIRKILINLDNGFQRFIHFQSEFKRLKQIQFINLNASSWNCLEEKGLGQLEVLDVWESDLGNEFHQILDRCVKLKRLEIRFCDGEYNWFARKYPTLEYFKLDPLWIGQPTGLPMFLKLNPNIRKFATTAEQLLKHQNAIMISNLKLNDLAIQVDEYDIDDFQKLCAWLNELHKREFYKQMQLYLIDAGRQEHIDRLAILHGLSKLCVDDDSSEEDTLVFPALKSLEELFLRDANKNVTENLTENLKRIHFRVASIDDIMPFIRRSVEMQRIKVNRLRFGAHFNEDTTNVIDLRALNGEREKLPDAAKIILFVEEKIYLATKWALGENDFGLIRLKRAESFDWDHDFGV